MAVRGGLTRFARPAGSPLTAFTVCPTGCRQLSTPGRGFSSPRCVQYTKKKPVLSYGLFFKYGGEGGIDSLRSPCGQPAHCVHGLSNWLSPVVDPRSGLLIPPGVCNIRKKSPYFRTSSSLNMAVRGGLTRFARPAGSPLTAFTVCPTGCRQLSTPGRGFSSPRCVQYTKKKPVLSYGLFFKYGGEGGIDSLRSPCGQPAHCVHGLSNWLSPVVDPRSGLLIPPGVCNIRKKSPYFRTSSSLNMAVRGGFEPPIRCRIHTFQACSFSHSDTSPNCRSCLAGTGANLGKS